MGFFGGDQPRGTVHGLAMMSGALIAHAFRRRTASTLPGRATLRSAPPSRGFEVYFCSSNEAVHRECVVYSVKDVVDFAGLPVFALQCPEAFTPTDRSRFPSRDCPSFSGRAISHTSSLRRCDLTGVCLWDDSQPVMGTVKGR